MKNYKITINGKTFEVGVEECGGSVQVQSNQPAISVSQVSAPVSAHKAAPAAPAPKAAAGPKVASGTGDVTAPMTGTVLSVAVSAGQQVKRGDLLLIFEAMKMENEIFAPRDGTVAKVHVSKGTVLETGMPLVSLA